MDGYEATRKIYEREQQHGKPHTPIIAMTANVMPDDQQKCLDTGMDDYLPKPVKTQDLSRMLSSWSKKLTAKKSA